MTQAANTWPDVLSSLLRGHDLTAGQASWAMGEIMDGVATPVQIAGFLVALRSKGESVEELTSIADQMLEHSRRIVVPEPSLDIVGTGGDRAHTVNISTMAAIVAAASGVTVVKHGNRAASSSSGTADVLEVLGVNLALDPDQVVDVARDAGITFCFAQVFHPSMRHVGVPRRELGIPTVFNVLGPLTNPAQPSYSAIGVADPRMAPLVAGVFARRGKDAAIFRGGDGLDEITTSTTSDVWWVRNGSIRQFVVDPARLGLDYSPLSALRGGLPADNARILLEVFGGQRGAVRDAVVLNAGVALALTVPDPAGVDSQDAEVASDAFHAGLRSAMDRAEAALDDGRAADRLRAWAKASQG